MKTIRKKHQRKRIDIKKQLAVLKPLKCRYCPWRFFSNTSKYLSHVPNHATRIKSYWYKHSGLYRPQAESKLENHEKTLQCRLCSKGFTTTTQKIFHEKYEHICDYCEKTFENAADKKLHLVQNHNMEEINKCSFCSRQFSTAKGKTIHERYEHICEFCEQLFENTEDKKLHKLDIHSEGEYLCRFCSCHLPTEFMKALHEKNVHRCDTCKKTFENAQAKKLHKCDNHGTEENKCRFCSRYFTKVKGKLGHEKLVHICDFPLCEETFEKAKVKKRHLLECHNTDIKKCRFCSTNFKTASQKTRHEKYVHLCNFCEESFENAEVKKHHECNCMDEKKYVCRFCSAYFITARGKTAHENSAHFPKL